jgi:hypothetical protein
MLIGILTVVPLAGVPPGQSVTSTGQAAQSSQSKAPVPNHALSGVVKSLDASRLVITRGSKNLDELTFVLNQTTQREGPIDVGAKVQVRFRTEGRTLIATAILAIAPKPRPKGKTTL